MAGEIHEPRDVLGPARLDAHRAIASLMEELEAVDWYDQRVAAASDAQLAAVLAHNRDEEKEHAAMTLEWLRRTDPVWDDVLRRYLFTAGPIDSLEDAESGHSDEKASPDIGAGAEPGGAAAAAGSRRRTRGRRQDRRP
jgi:ferritin-like protein